MAAKGGLWGPYRSYRDLPPYLGVPSHPTPWRRRKEGGGGGCVCGMGFVANTSQTTRGRYRARGGVLGGVRRGRGGRGGVLGGTLPTPHPLPPSPVRPRRGVGVGGRGGSAGGAAAARRWPPRGGKSKWGGGPSAGGGGVRAVGEGVTGKVGGGWRGVGGAVGSLRGWLGR